MAQALFVRHDLHRTAAQHVARANEHRIAYPRRRAHARFDVGHRFGFGLGDAQLLHDFLEAAAVLGVADRLAVGADDGYSQRRQRFGQVDGRLPAQRHHNGLGTFQPDDVHHVLHRQRLEVELIAGRVVRRHGFRVVVDDDRFVARFAYRPDGMHRRIVEFHALPDPDGSRTQHHDFLLVADHRFVFLLVGRVEIGHVRRKFARAGVYHLVDRENAVLLAQAEHLLLRKAPQLPDVFVAETHALGVAQGLRVARIRPHNVLELDDVLEFFEEEHVDFRVVVYQHQVDAAADELRYGVQTVVGAGADVFQQAVGRPAVEFPVVDVADARFQRAYRLEQRFLHRTAHGHHFARGFHLRPQHVRRVRELVEREAGYLGHHVVERGLERSRGVGDADFVQRQPHRYLGAHPRNRVTRSFRRQGRRARHARVHFDQIVLERQRVQGELHVAAPLDFQLADDFQRRIAQHLIFAVRERLARRHHDRIARVHAHRVDVLHVADGDGRVVAVADHLVLDLLVALDALLDEHLVHGREEERIAHDLAELRLVVGEAAARAAQREGRAQHHGIADALRGREALLHRVGDLRGQHRLAERLAQLLEQLAVLGPLDAVERRAEDLHLALLQDALAGQLHGEVEARLAAEARHDGVRTLVADDLGHVFERQRLHVHLVGDVRVGHDRGRVGVHQHHFVTLLLERKARLRARIVEFGGLTDYDRARADDHHFPYVGSLRHFSSPPSFE